MYVEREYLRKELLALMKRRGVEGKWLAVTFDAQDIEWLIGEAPEVDATKVVRCKNCKHWGTGDPVETDYGKVCEFAGWLVGANGYCVYGEKKEEE